jgi:hypothetical protein
MIEPKLTSFPPIITMEENEEITYFKLLDKYFELFQDEFAIFRYGETDKSNSEEDEREKKLLKYCESSNCDCPFEFDVIGIFNFKLIFEWLNDSNYNKNEIMLEYFSEFPTKEEYENSLFKNKVKRFFGIKDKNKDNNSNSNIHHLNLEPKRIFRPSNSRGNFNNSINHPNSCIDNNNISPLEKLTKKLKLRGLRGIMNLHKQFIFTCPNLSHINLSYFIQVLKNQKINLEKNEYFDIFEKFSKNNILNFTKFIREFKKPLNDTRLQSVEDAFSKLDVDSNDNIFIETIKKKYNPKGSPLVKQGIKNEEEVTTEFLDCFELNYNLLTAVDNQNVTNVVSFEEFANFYEYVSFLYDNDDEFCKMVEESWDD